MILRSFLFHTNGEGALPVAGQSQGQFATHLEQYFLTPDAWRSAGNILALGRACEGYADLNLAKILGYHEPLSMDAAKILGFAGRFG
jgi:hypothetical protein